MKHHVPETLEIEEQHLDVEKHKLRLELSVLEIDHHQENQFVEIYGLKILETQVEQTLEIPEKCDLHLEISERVEHQVPEILKKAGQTDEAVLETLEKVYQ